MSQPTNIVYPVAYDDEDTLLGELRNREVYTVNGLIDVDDLYLPMAEALTNVNLPTYITFAGGEIAYVETIGGAGDKIFICSSLDDRGALGTKIQPHGIGEMVILGAVSPYHILYKLATIAGQHYQGLVGIDAAKSATPDPGHRFTAIDTGKVYYCFVADNWVDVIVYTHAHTTGREDDDHTQYHNDGRADTWHTAEPGDHIVDGDDHLHKAGAAVLRIHGGVNGSKPANPTEDGEIYYSTDLDGGTLFVGLTVGETLIWVKISGVPAGGILAFPGACPPGWERYTELDERIPMGAAAAGATGGAATHVHTYSAHRQHYHSLSGGLYNTEYPGSHTHPANFKNASGTTWRPYELGIGDGSCTTSYAGGHIHTVNIPQANTANAGEASPETAAGDNVPASRQVVWCKKL